MKLALLLGLLAFTPLGEYTSPTLHRIGTSNAEMLVRRYDLIAHTGASNEYNSARSLFPGSLAQLEVGDSERRYTFDPNGMYHTIIDLLGEELEYEGRFHSLSDHGSMLLRGPQELHDRAAAILRAFGQAAHSASELRVVVLDVEEGQVDLPVGLVDPLEAMKWLDLESKSAPQHYSVPLALRGFSQTQSSSLHRFLGDFDVEVAQNSLAYDPQLIELQTGTRISVAGSPIPGGTSLSLVYLHGSSAAGVETQRLDVVGRTHTDAGFSRATGAETLQSMRIGQRSVALNTAIPDGKALVLLSRFEGMRDGGTQVVILQVRGESQPAVRTTRLPGGGALHFIRRNSVEAGHLNVNGRGTAPLAHDSGYRVNCSRHEPWLEASFDQDDTGILGEVLEDALPEMKHERSDDWIIAFREGGEQDGDTQRIKELVHSVALRMETVHVTLELERNDGTGTGKMLAELAMRVGVESAVVLGDEYTTVNDYDIEIAHGSSLADPSVQLALDGLMVIVKPMRSVDGELSLQLRGGARLLRSVDEISAQDQSFGRLELSSFDSISLDETVHFSGSGKQVRVLGNTARNLADHTMRLTVSVR
ncbi:MAG: hypothetical protein ACI9F9_000647 [Candidatus Paceibacteria bacterium]|jgi:hypothetical protein